MENAFSPKYSKVVGRFSSGYTSMAESLYEYSHRQLQLAYEYEEDYIFAVSGDNGHRLLFQEDEESLPAIFTIVSFSAFRIGLYHLSVLPMLAFHGIRFLCLVVEANNF